MALPAGRVGVERSQVDFSGKIKGTAHYRHDVAFEPDTTITMQESGILTVDIVTVGGTSSLLVLEDASGGEIAQYAIPINNDTGVFTLGVLKDERVAFHSITSASGTLITI